MGRSPTRKPSLYYTLDYPVVDRDKKDYNSGLIGDSRAIPPPSFDINDCEHKRLNDGRSTNGYTGEITLPVYRIVDPVSDFSRSGHRDFF